MIRIQNIYHMLAYAFQVLREDSYAQMATEEFAHTLDLLAAILAMGIGKQIRRGLGKEYVDRTETSSSPVGKINVSASVQQQTMRKKRVTCCFDEFTENAYVNRILRSTAELLLDCPGVSRPQKKALRKLLPFFHTIDTVRLSQIQWSGIRYHRNNVTYKMLMNICYLIIEGMLWTSRDGNQKLAQYVDDQRMHELYERFVLEYYRKHFSDLHPAPRHIDWNVGDGMVDFLPTMKSDITLARGNRRLIIDTKYYGRTMQTHGLYGSRSLHSNHLYQIFTYVKNADRNASGTVQGVLLYAKTDEDIVPDNEYRMGSNRIAVRTLDLNADFASIAAKLDSVAVLLG